MISTDDPHRLLALSAELEAFAATSSDPWHELYATSNQLRAYISLGQFDEAAAVLDRHMAASDRGRYPAFQFVGHAFAVVLHLAAGRFDEAERSAERAHALGSAGNTPFDAGVYGLQMFAIRREQGRLSEVAPVLKLVSAAQTAQPLWRPGLAALYADLGLLDEARREFEALAGDGFATIPRDAVWPACATFLADVCVALRDRDRALELYEALIPFAGRNIMAGMTICFGPGDRFLGNARRAAPAARRRRAALPGGARPGRTQSFAGVAGTRPARPRPIPRRARRSGRGGRDGRTGPSARHVPRDGLARQARRRRCRRLVSHRAAARRSHPPRRVVGS